MYNLLSTETLKIVIKELYEDWKNDNFNTQNWGSEHQKLRALELPKAISTYLYLKNGKLTYYIYTMYISFNVAEYYYDNMFDSSLGEKNENVDFRYWFSINHNKLEWIKVKIPDWKKEKILKKV